MRAGSSQRTISQPVALDGTGLHSGLRVAARLVPGERDAGIRFRRIDLPDTEYIDASVENAVDAERRTELRRGDIAVHTVEHLLAAASSLEIDNLDVELGGPEPPALDGSAAPWAEALTRAGIENQGAVARIGAVTAQVSLEQGDSRYTVSPWESYRIAATIQFDHPLVGTQSEVAEVDATFIERIAPARTFGLARWKDELRAKGLALGASMGNTVVLTDEGLADGTSLRYPNEFVRHKIVDIVGDLSLLGVRLRADVTAVRPSHTGNLALARMLREHLETRYA